MNPQTLDLDELTRRLGVSRLQVMAIEIGGKKYHKKQTQKNQATPP
jgi:hypothetical protein